MPSNGAVILGCRYSQTPNGIAMIEARIITERTTDDGLRRRFAIKTSLPPETVGAFLLATKNMSLPIIAGAVII